MRLNWKMLGLLATAVLVSTGCGGINASQNVSPASFLIPGLLKNDPGCGTNAPIVMVETANNSCLASAR